MYQKEYEIFSPLLLECQVRITFGRKLSPSKIGLDSANGVVFPVGNGMGKDFLNTVKMPVEELANEFSFAFFYPQSCTLYWWSWFE